MKFQGVFRIGEKETRPGKNGEYCKVTISCYGATFKLFLPEKLVPDAIEGQDALITFELSAGKYFVPEVKIVKIEPA